MGGNEPERKCGAEAGCDERGGASDESVDDNGNPFRCGPQREAGEHSDLEAADRRQHTDGIPPVRAIDVDAALDHGDLVPPRYVVDAGAVTGDLLWRQAGQRGDDRAGGGRISDPHLAEADEANALARKLLCRVEPNID